jgi:hypothetical protein
MWRHLLAAALISALGGSARGAKNIFGPSRSIFTCSASDLTFSHYRRVPRGEYPKDATGFCEASGSVGCTFQFCPSLSLVIGCYLNPNVGCGVAQPSCPPSRAEVYSVPAGQRMKLRLGNARVRLRCRR